MLTEPEHLASRRAVCWRGPALIALAAVGVAISAYLTWVHFSGVPALCTDTGSCEQVQSSRFATVAGVPIALLGLGLYLSLLGLSLWQPLAAGRAAPALVPLALFALPLAGSLYSAYLTFLELFVIRAICPWCVASALVLVLICALAAWDLASQADAAGERER